MRSKIGWFYEWGSLCVKDRKCQRTDDLSKKFNELRLINLH